MDSTIPLLNPQQIDELNNMIHGISQENKKKLDDLLSQVADVQNTSILNLYKLVVDQWTKKQKIIDNLCHFSLTMMSTVQLLWDQKQDHEERLTTAEIVIENLQKNVDELGNENEKFRMKINEAETHIESISGQKQKFQQLYKSQSCCNFADGGYLSQIQTNSQIVKQCQTCGEHKSLLQKQKDDFIKETSELREQKIQLQKKFEELMEEHKLVKMEIQLAEIAVKDALSYRESSIANRSDIMNRSDEIYTTKSHAQFMNGELQCFSNSDDSFNYEKRQILANQISNHENIVHFISTPQLPLNDHEQSDLKLTITHEETTIQSPFKKKISKRSDERRYNTEANDKDQQLENTYLRSDVKQTETKVVKDKKTVSLQCNLLKNIPKIKLFKKVQSDPISDKKSKIQPKNDQQNQKRKEKPLMTQSQRVISKSEIIKPVASKNQRNQRNQPKQAQQSSISRFFNFISSKVITNRIKVK